MASLKAILFAVVVLVALFAVSSAQERVKKQVLLASPYAGVHGYPWGWARSAYPYALPLGDDGSYFPGKYDALY